MARCPECGSSRIDQYRMPYGPMWCRDCGFRVEEKMATPNPFVEADKGATADHSQGHEGRAAPGKHTDTGRQSLGEALYEISRARRGRRARDPSESTSSGEQVAGPPGDGPTEG
jgi:transcription initiation factor TFIIIB Brf1 subunit/transcription initiation factor TFIIB